MASGLRPSLLEFLDGTTARAIQDYRDMGLPANVGSLLLAQSDRGAARREDVAAIAEICTRARRASTSPRPPTPRSPRCCSRPAAWCTPAHGPARRVTLVDDVAVPRSRLVALLHGIAAIAKEYDVLIACPGHVGDGNMHPTVIFPTGPTPHAQRARWRRSARSWTSGLALGGTITGEHGVGMLKRDGSPRSSAHVDLQLQRDVKAVFDPQGLLNPDKLFL